MRWCIRLIQCLGYQHPIWMSVLVLVAPPLIVWEDSRGCSKALDPCVHVEGWERVPSSQLKASSTLAIVAVWGMDQ